MSEDHLSDLITGRHITRAEFLRLAAAVGAAGLAVPMLASCGGNGISQLATGRPVIRLGADRDWGYPNPYGYDSGPGYWRTTRLFDTLIWKDSTGNFIPWLATHWDTPDEGSTWRFTLRDGIRWQDGKPLTAQDVAFTFKYLQDNSGPPTAGIAVPRGVAAAIAKSDTDVEIQMDIPLATFLRTQAGAVPILPKHVWEKVTDPIAFAHTKDANIGSGPYRLASYSPGQATYDFTANDGYFLGKPYVKRILEVPAANARDPLRSDPSLGVIDGPADFGNALYFNSSHGPLADLRVRKAIAYAIDRPDMVKRSLGGLGTPGNPGFFPPSNPIYDRNVATYPHDLNMARALLDSAGYPLQGEVRQGPGGPLRLGLLFSSDDSTNAELIASYLKAVGIAVQDQPAEGTDLDNRTTAGQYELSIQGIPALGGEQILNVIFGTLPGQDAATSGGVPGFNNPDFKMAVRRQNIEFDPVARGRLLNQVQSIIADQLPLLMLYYGTLSFAFRRRVFDAWYFTPGGFAAGIPSVYNKQVFVTGQKEGTSIRPFTE